MDFQNLVSSETFQWITVACALAGATMLHSAKRKDQFVATAMFLPSSFVPVALFGDFSFIVISTVSFLGVAFWNRKWTKWMVGTGALVAASFALGLPLASLVHRSFVCGGMFGAATVQPKITVAFQFMASLTAGILYWANPQPIMLAWVSIPVVAFVSPYAKEAFRKNFAKAEEAVIA